MTLSIQSNLNVHSPSLHKQSTYGGILNDLLQGLWTDPVTGNVPQLPIENIAIERSLDGMEGDLISRLHPGQSVTVVCDTFTYEAMGKRVIKNLQSSTSQPLGTVKEFVWQNPRCSVQGVHELQDLCPKADIMVAVGSGTVSDSVKYASFLDGRPYSVFATSPMNAYTTSTASISFDGFKKSLTCHGAKGVFFDLEILTQCPGRLISAAFADVICRTTSQVDWLLSHMLFNTPYVKTPYALLAYDEDAMIDGADSMVKGNIDALATLTRISAIMGLGTYFTGTTHSGSMAEHMVSHYIDMFAGENHPGTSHGEQVGVATLAIAKLQAQILNADAPPMIYPTQIPTDILAEKFPNHVDLMVQETQKKAISQAEADRINAYLNDSWQDFVAPLRAVMVPYSRLYDAMTRGNCPRTGRELGLQNGFFADAIRYSRFIRNRFSILDLADDAHLLDTFARTCD